MDSIDFSKPLTKGFAYPQDIYAVFYAVGGWATLHLALHYLTIKPLGQIVYPASKKSGADSLDLIAKRAKLYQAAWKLVFFSILSGLGMYILYFESWTFHPDQYFKGWPNQDMSDLMRFYYTIELAGYMYSIVLMPFEPKQYAKDVIAMLIHHTSTILLLGFSYYYSCHRIGIVIAALHDISDPFMELAKLVLYAGYHKMADVFFAIFALSFIITRNFVFPYYIVMSIPIHAVYAGVPVPTKNLNYAFQAFLWTLEVLHLYWGFLILKMVKRAIVASGVEDDIRNVDEDKVKVE
ncbi:TLC domain-containing protein [Globomyces pollinis-pini]|nr:TLC domain-containing protein [Globomyces pollinis-pini]